MRVHRANLGRLKKRIRKYNRTTYKNKKQHIEQAQHVPDLMETDALQQVGPPSIDDEIYQTYLNQINTNCISIVVRQEKLKPTKDDPIIKSNPNRDIVRLINSGAVWECSLHKVFISQSITRYSTYTNEDDVLPVVVYLGRLRDTLIPFHEPTDNPGTFMTNDVNFLSSYTCFVDKDSHLRMFYKNRQKYLRLGDVVSDRCIAKCMEYSVYGPNCVFLFWAVCDYGRFLRIKRFKASKSATHKRLERAKRLVPTKKKSMKRTPTAFRNYHGVQIQKRKDSKPCIELLKSHPYSLTT